MNLEGKESIKAINKEDTYEIYRCLAQYTCNKYYNLPMEIKPIFKNKNDSANRIISYYGKTNKSNDEIIEYLNQAKKLINNIRKDNESTNLCSSSIILEIIKNSIPDNLSEIEKCEYIFDYVTKTTKYAEEYYNCILNLFNDFDLEFNNGIPIPNTPEEILTTREGVCDDISNLMIELGKKFNLKIGKVFCEHNGNLHAFNYINLEDGTISLFDATSRIRTQESKKSTFLVSFNELNQNNEYILNVNDDKYSIITSAKSIVKKPPKYNIDQIILETNLYIPDIDYISIEGLEKRMI